MNFLFFTHISRLSFRIIAVLQYGGCAMQKKPYTITPEFIQNYLIYQEEQERSAATIQKYAHDLTELYTYLNGQPLNKLALIGWKQELTETYAPTTVNSMLTAVNGYLSYMGWPELRIKLLKIQRSLFLDEQKELTRSEYFRLVRVAEQEGKERLSLVIQTICATGIRVSELRFITAEAVCCGRAGITNKGKRRTVFLPDKLRRLLKQYLKTQKITTGAVFVTRTGKALDRSNIWRDMKALCERAGVDSNKVFPHNLRHLFARTFYSLERDLSRLADILGHSNVSTTRIYTAESGATHAKQMERMGLVIT